VEPSDIILIKKKYRNNYIARLVWSLVLFAFVIFKVKGFLLVFFAAHIGLSIIWIALVELNAPVIYWENL